MLTRICVRGYKSLEHLDLCLGPLTVIFGPNAAGKSNLLDALQLLSRVGTRPTLGEAFGPPHRGDALHSFHYGKDGIAGLLRHERVGLTIEADLQLSTHTVERVNAEIEGLRQVPRGDNGPGVRRGAQGGVRERRLRYRVSIEVTPADGRLRVADENLAALSDSGEPSRKRQPFISADGDEIRLRAEGRGHPTYHQRYLDHTVVSLPLYAPHYPHVAALRRELENWRFFYLEPRERMRAPSSVAEVHHIGPMGENLASFLNTLRALHPGQFQAIERALSAIVPTVTGLHVEPNRFGQLELSLLEGDAAIPATLASEGTLRVLGLLALCGAQEPPSLIGFEEPENGIHPRRLRHVASLLETRVSSETQIIVTTHSPLLPDLVPEPSLYVCSRRSGATTVEPLAYGGLFRASAVTSALDDEAASPTSVCDRILRGDFDD